MKSETRRWLKAFGGGDPAMSATDALDSDARQKAEIRRLNREVARKDRALKDAVAEFKRRGQSPWLPCVTCEEALKPPKKGKS